MKPLDNISKIFLSFISVDLNKKGLIPYTFCTENILCMLLWFIIFFLKL